VVVAEIVREVPVRVVAVEEEAVVPASWVMDPQAVMVYLTGQVATVELEAQVAVVVAAVVLATTV
jgi:hypothetical protein